MLRIGCSRVLSYSMFIEALVELKELLRYDQMIEVCFYASLLNSPVLFHHIVMNLIARHKDSKEDFKFGKHPVYDILDATMTLLGNNSETDSSKIKWQSGFEPRFSPAGGHTPFPTLFGAHPNASPDERAAGERLMEKIVSILFDYTEWIDKDLKGCGNNPLVDMPLQSIQECMKCVVERIASVQKCQFHLFRLGVFTTILTGTGLLQSGPHLRQLAIPCPGTASLTHLLDPNDMTILVDGKPNDEMDINSYRPKTLNRQSRARKKTNGQYKMSPDEYDCAMQSIAVGLNIPYHRDIIETLLVSFGVTTPVFLRSTSHPPPI